MHVAIYHCNADLYGAVKLYVERRLRFALRRFGGHVGRVVVTMLREGPTHNRCAISIEVPVVGRVAVEESNADLFVAIDRATRKIGKSLRRELERARDISIGSESVRLVA